MSVVDRLQSWRVWFPVPQPNWRFELVRWLLLEGNRHAVTSVLLFFVFASLMLVGTYWTFEMQQILTETQAVQSILITLLSGIILLVSIVVSISSIVLSYDITSVDTQEDRLTSVMEFRGDIGRLTDTGASPTDPESFLDMMSEVVPNRARALGDTANAIDDEHVEDVTEFTESVIETFEGLRGPHPGASGAEFGILWLGLEIDYGPYMDTTRRLRAIVDDDLSDGIEQQLDDLRKAFQLFATGKEYFKTMYYSKEVARLSRTLLLISLPAILINASTVLAINSGQIPDVFVLGLPPLLTFVAITFTISLAPFVVLTSFMLRLTTVASRTVSAGLFSLQS